MEFSGIPIKEIKKKARQNLEQGAVTSHYRANRAEVVSLLNSALATELVCVLRYQRHYQMAVGLSGQVAAEEFLQHAKEEQEHADKLAERITQLGGDPDYNPATLSDRSHTEYMECNTLEEMLRENLVAERIVIDIYAELVRYLGNNDPTTRRIVEKILAEEEEHADELSNMLASSNQAYTQSPRLAQTA